MRVEGHRHRRPAVFGRAAFHTIDDLLVSAVQTVEVAKREHGMDDPWWTRIVRKVQDLHPH
jgi:hypothetical protein